MRGVISTQYGKITINNNVIAKIAGLTAVECFGIVGMAALNKTDGIVKLLTKNSLARGVFVSAEGDGLTIEFHVIVAYGISLSTVAENLIQSVKYQVENLTNFKVKNIKIFIEGVRVTD